MMLVAAVVLKALDSCLGDLVFLTFAAVALFGARSRDGARALVAVAAMGHAVTAVIVGVVCFNALTTPETLPPDLRALGSSIAPQAYLGLILAGAQFVGVILAARRLRAWIGRDDDGGGGPPRGGRRVRLPRFSLPLAWTPAAGRT